MRILHICSELAPIAKVGGLADVVFGLAKAVAELGHEVEILLPKYDCLDYSALKNLRIEKRDLWSYEGFQRINNTLWSAELGSIKIFLLEAHHPALYFTRGKIYGCDDDIDRFIYFSRAAMEAVFKTDTRPDVIHLHDWPTALCTVLYKDMYQALGLKNIRTVFTIHNMLHQGKCSPFNLNQAGLLGESYLQPNKMLDPIIPGLVNLLKGGMIYADAVTTVSPTYREEIATPEGGCDLDSVTRSISPKLSGILNGVDPASWDPASDPYLVKHYSAKNCGSHEGLTTILEAKAENRKFLQMHLALTKSTAPLVACISRLVPQKGPDLIKDCILRTLELGGQFILLGSQAPKELEESFLKLKEELRNDANVAIWLDHDETLAHLLFASADILIVPSIFEPCGLTQLIAMRYGTVPLVRETGGLADTIFDIDTASVEQEKRNGFTFKHPDEGGVRWALDRAIKYKLSEPERWAELMRNGLNADFSWKRSAQQYLEVYQGVHPERSPSEGHV